MAKERLQKFMAAAGVDSRRNCEQMILDGMVKVNGKIVSELPAFIDTEEDSVTVRGRKLSHGKRFYYLLNKPKGVICTNSDPQGRPKAIDLVDTRERIFCVGRLDVDTTGLIILTNDSELSNRLTHPKYELAKTYVARLRGGITPEAIDLLKKGVWLPDGKTQPANVKVLKKSTQESLVEMTINQGLNRQVARTFLKVGFKVLSLKREKIGKISCRGLGVGHWRHMTKAEVNYLKGATKTAQES